MKTTNLKLALRTALSFFTLMLFINCGGSDDTPQAPGDTSDPNLVVIGTLSSFGNVTINEESNVKQLQVQGDDLESSINISVTGDFLVSIDNVSFVESMTISAEEANNPFVLYVKFIPTELGNLNGVLTIQNDDVPTITRTLQGYGVPVVHNYVTFDEQPVGFGGGFTRAVEGTFTVHSDISNISQIKMFVQIDCPNTG
jgi:hypothetical protein